MFNMKDVITKVKKFILIPVLILTIAFNAGCFNSKGKQAAGDANPVITSDTNPDYSPGKESLPKEGKTGSEPGKPAETAKSPNTTETVNNNGKEHENPDGKTDGEPLEIQGLVLVKDIIPDCVIELKYAIEDNFTNRKVYPYDICVLQKSTAEKLAKANKELMEMGYRLKIWDAYRPLSVQKIFWEIVPDSRYVANPNTGGSKHNRGTAVDVTLVDMDGNELEMPTGFDDFTEKASRNYANVSEEAKKHVDILTNVMVKNGFTTISTEWWHYNDSDSAKYEALDVSLEEFLQGDAPMDNSVLKIDPNIDKLNNYKGISNVSQILLVMADDAEDCKATARAYEKVNGLWQPVFEVMEAVIGNKGLTYDKKEGDKKSPAGMFPLYRCFGSEENPGTKLIYTKFEKNDFWVDDVNSEFYNTYQKGLPGGRWNSAEDLFETGKLYRYFVVVEYNTDNPVPGKGSAIFLHIWKGKDSYTSGCTAMSEENLLKIIRWLEPAKNPHLLQIPANDF